MKKLKMLLGLAGMIIVFAMATGCKNNVDNNSGTSEPGVTNQSGAIKGKVVYQEGVTDFSGINVYLEKLDSNGRSASVTESAEKGRAANVFFASTVTAKDGSYSFSELADGNYTVYASNGDEAAYISATVAEGRSVTVEDLKLVLKGSISGTLQVTGGNAAGSIVGVAGTSYIAFVGSDGKFTISGVPAGKHKLCVMTNGKYKAFETEYNVDGITTASAGKISVTVESSSSESGISYVTARATDRGIEFSGDILNNIHSNNATENSYFYNTTAASASIGIKDNGSGVEMIQNFVKPYNYSNGWRLTYPLVEKGKEYNFTVKAWYGSYIIYEENFTLTAQGGLGEYKIENADKYGVEITKERVIQRTGKAVYTDNPNVKVQREGLVYELYRDDGSWWQWVTSSADYPRWLDTTDGKMDLKNISSVYQSWQSFEGSIEPVLSGYNYIVTAFTRLLITGWTYNDSVVFKMNDYVEAKGSWGGEKAKKLVTYGIGIVSRYYDDGFAMPEEYGSSSRACRSKEVINAFLKANELSLSNMPGKEIEVLFGERDFEYYGESVTYPYANILEMAEKVYEPEQIPVLKFNNDENKYNLIFKGWRVGTWNSYSSGSANEVFPYNGYWRGGESTYNIDGKTVYSVPLYAVFELIPTAIITAKFKLDEKSDTVYATLISQPGDGAYGRFNVPKDPEREGYVFNGWYYIDEDGKRNTFYGQYNNTFYSDVTIYADWSKIFTATLMDGNTKLGTEDFIEGNNSLDTVPPAKEGYIFIGWYLDKDFTKTFDSSITDNVTVYAKFAKAELLLADINDDTKKIEVSMLSNLDVGDTLCFELCARNIYYPSYSSRDNGMYGIGPDGIDYYISYSRVKPNQTKIVTLTYTSKDNGRIQNIRNAGLNVHTSSDDVVIKNIYYIKGPRVNLSIYDGTKLFKALEVAPNTKVTIPSSLMLDDSLILEDLYLDSNYTEPWDYYASEDLTVYAKFIENEVLWKGSASDFSLNKNDVDFSKLEVGDSLYFVIDYGNNGNYVDRKLIMHDYNGYATKRIDYKIDFYETKYINYVFTSDDNYLIERIKDSGLYLSTNDCKFIQLLYVKGNQ